MTEPAEKHELVYENVDTAPFVYFDISPTHGILSGAIQIELAGRILNTAPDGGVERPRRCHELAQRHRCIAEDARTSATSARAVRNHRTLNAALDNRGASFLFWSLH